MTDAPRGFIEIAEVWTVDAATDRLTLASGIYGGLTGFAEASARTSFAKGEGLPGAAWETGRPVVINGLHGSGFKRLDAAEAAGLTSAIAIPVFADAALTGVITFLCAEDDTRAGAIEIWAMDADRQELALESGYYGAAKAFAAVSAATRFARGSGLPGAVWASRAAILLRDLGGSFRFIRAQSAGEAGLTTGLGIPLETADGETVVLALLSATAAPIAGRFELWDAVGGSGADAKDMVLVDGLCARTGALWATPKRAKAWSGAIGRVAATGVPIALGAGEAPGLPAGWRSVVAIPIHRAGRLAQIAAWYF
jgi:hypothetical protein